MSYFMKCLSVSALLVFCFMSAACEQKPEEPAEGLNVSANENAGSSSSVSTGATSGTGSTGGGASNEVTSDTGEENTSATSGESSDSNSEDVAATETEEGESQKIDPNAFVAFSTNSVSVADGANFSLDVKANLLAVSEGGGISLRYDPSILEVVTVNVNSSVWNFVARNGQINNSEGFVSDILFSSYSGVSGETVIATIEFKSINKGSSSIVIEESSVNPFASNGELMTVVFESANVVAN